MIEVYVTNLGKYNEGELVGEWFSLPAELSDLQDCFERIGIDEQYEEYFLTDYQSDVKGLIRYIDQYTPVSLLNKLADPLSKLSEEEIATVESVIEMGDVNSLADVFNLIENLDNYQLLNDVNSDEDLGYYWVEDSGCYDLNSMPNLKFYIDYEKLGRDIRLNEGGYFSENGYILNVG